MFSRFSGSFFFFVQTSKVCDIEKSAREKKTQIHSFIFFKLIFFINKKMGEAIVEFLLK